MSPRVLEALISLGSIDKTLLGGWMVSLGWVSQSGAVAGVCVCGSPGAWRFCNCSLSSEMFRDSFYLWTCFRPLLFHSDCDMRMDKTA